MKKIYMVIVLVLLVAMIPMAAMAADDSVTIDDTTREILSVPEDETVIRVYNGLIVYELAEAKKIDTILQDPSKWDVVYVWADDGETQCQSIAEGKAVAPSESNSHAGSYFLEKHKKHKSILHTLVLNVEIKEVYYFADCQMLRDWYIHEDALIYYVTDKGDYIMYDPDMAEESDEYLMTVEDFQPNAQEITHIRRTTSIGQGEFVFIPPGLAAYKISGYRWRNALLWGIPVVLVAGGAGVFVYLKKKKKAGTPPEDAA